MNKPTLFLYVDCDNITAAYSDTGGKIHPVSETDDGRLWLYFYEETDSISFGKQYRSHCRNKETHYYGNVLSDIVAGNRNFQIGGLPFPIRDIFNLSGILRILQRDPSLKNMDVYVSFSWDVPYPVCNNIFREILEEKEIFKVKESVVRLPQLALELYSRVKGEDIATGIFLVLEALGDNLQYSVYRNEGSGFVGFKPEPGVLKGKGADLRKRILAEQIVNQINGNCGLLSSKEEVEAEIIRLLSAKGDDFLQRMDKHKGNTSIHFYDIHFACAPGNGYDASIQRSGQSGIESLTRLTVEDCIGKILSDLPEGIGKEAITDIICIGDAFKNKMYTRVLSKKCPNARLKTYSSKDIPNIVSAYRFIQDFKQFDKIRELVRERSDMELEKIRRMETKRQREAELNKRNREEFRFQQSISAARQAEKAGDYTVIKKHLEAALALKPDDATAKKKLSEAEKKLSELKQLEKKKTAAFFDSVDKQKQPAKTAAAEKPKSAPKPDDDFFNTGSDTAKQQAAATEKPKSTPKPDYDFFNSDSFSAKQRTAATEKPKSAPKPDDDFFNTGSNTAKQKKSKDTNVQQKKDFDFFN